MIRQINCFNDLTNKEMDLIAKHQANDERAKFTVPFKAWIDEDNNLCVRYTEDLWFHYNVARGEWW